MNDKQQQVLDTLRKAQGPLSAYALLDRLRDSGFSAPTQVYRALESLMREGWVHRLETLNAYTSCSLGCLHGCTAFAICERCGHIDELVDSDLNGVLDSLAQGHQFSLESTTIEMRGKCSTCAGLAPSA
nr:Fur family transcriptional regulator [uncultured Halomonas sp.]